MKLKDAILAHQDDFVRALDADFGHRAAQETLLYELRVVIASINYLQRNLARWMRPERRRVAMTFLPGSVRVIHQPLGVIGIISPWNYPIALALDTGRHGAGRRQPRHAQAVGIQPATASLLASLLAEVFQADQVAVVTGNAKIGSAFSNLPFDHILFTGSIPVGRAIMRAASENLVPVTLGLGGKSPVIVERGCPLRTAVRRIAYGKLANAGQTCIAPDYALIPEEHIEDFVAAYEAEVEKLYPNIAAQSRLQLGRERSSLCTAVGAAGRCASQRCACNRNRDEARQRRCISLADVATGARARCDGRDGCDEG